ncbi:MAG TPA: calcium/proton exchanger [Aggregatilineales bacterium]|nr:calcium/proton exchanger [Aggregatilineales bacterium]
MVKTIIYGLLLFLPIAVIAELTHADPLLIFVVSALAIIPLAKFIGEATEELAIYTGPKFGGLLNATLGNAAELIITVFAIRAGLLDLVRASITGSILGNLLLVLGLSLLVGGLKNGVQIFDRRTASINATLVILAVVALMIPSLFDAAIQENKAAELGLSEAVAVVMIILYGLSVFYTFQQSKNSAHVPVVHEPEEKQEEEVHHTPKWSVRFSLGVLAAATLGIVFMSEFLVGAVQHVTEEIGLTEFFIGIIVIPMVGNVAEHLVAVQVAYKNKMELSLAISLGSSLQIALFVAPALVFISVLMGNPLLLVFNEFELIALIGASIIAAFIAQDAESNWLEGAMLLGVYLMLGFAFYFLPAIA